MGLMSILDAVMCVLWMATYTLVLIGTVKYQYPLISLNTQAIIAPLEFSCLLMLIKTGQFGLDYVSLAYLYWSVIEIMIFLVTIKNGYIKRKYIAPYLCVVAVITCGLIYYVTIKEYLLFFNYVNTFAGVIFWLIFLIRDTKIPICPIMLAAFVAKFIADMLAVVVYLPRAHWGVGLICLFLPILDSVFIFVYLYRRKKMRNLSCT